MPFSLEIINGEYSVTLECDFTSCESEAEYICHCHFPNTKLACGAHNIEGVTCSCTSVSLYRPTKDGKIIDGLTTKKAVPLKEHFADPIAKMIAEMKKEREEEKTKPFDDSNSLPVRNAKTID